VAAQQLLVRVSGFKVRGSEGSANFGQPSDILTRNDIKMVMRKLEALLACNIPQSQPPSSPLRSQAGDLPETESPLPATLASQHVFATQVPHEVPTDRQRQVPNLSPSKLIDLLKNQNPASSLKDATSPQSVHPGLLESAPKCAQNSSVLKPLSGEKVRDMTSRLEAKANEQQSQSPVSSQPFTSVDSKNQLPFLKAQNEVEFPHLPASDSEKENSQETPKVGRKALHITKSGPIDPYEQERQSVQVSFMDIFQNGNPFEGLKRVPRKYVRIPEGQQSLLEHKDAWYKLKSGSQASHARIPARVHKDLITFLSHQLTTQSANIENQENESESDDSEDEHSTHDLKSEEPGGGKNASEYNGSTDAGNYLNGSNTKLPASKVSSDDTGHAPLAEMSITALSTDQSIWTRIISSSSPSGLIFEADDADESESGNMSDDERGACSPTPDRNLGVSGAIFDSHENQPSTNDYDLSHWDRCVGLPGNTTVDFADLPHMRGIDDPMVVQASTAPRRTSQQRCPSHDGPGHVWLHASRYQRKSIGTSSSSPVDDDDLELEVPYAVGDEIEERDREDVEAKEFSQEMRSEVPQTSRLIQVEQTPFPHDGESKRGRLQHANGSPIAIWSSDPRIPATFNDAHGNSSIFEEMHSLFKPVSQHSIATNEQKIDHVQLENDVPSGNASEGEDQDQAANLAERQLCLEYESSQLKERELDPSTIKTALSSPSDGGLDIVRTEAEVSPPSMKIATARALQGLLRPPLKMASPPRKISQPSDCVEENSPANAPPSELQRDGFQDLPREMAVEQQRRMRPSITQREEPASRDTKEMARAFRHSFNDRLHAALGEPEVSRSTKSLLGPLVSTPMVPQSNLVVDHLLAPSPGIVVRSSYNEKLSGAKNFSAVSDQSTSDEFEKPHSTSRLRTVSQNEEGPEALGPVLEASLESVPSSRNGSEEKGHLATDFLDEYAIDSPPSQNIFDKFKSAYPEYTGSHNAFTRALVYIEWLREGQRLHPSLWDDFIRVLAEDYHEYTEENQYVRNRMTGLEFYDHVEHRIYQGAIITRYNLQEALSTLDQKMVAKYRKEYARGSKDLDDTNPSGVPSESKTSVPSIIPQQARVGQASATVTDIEHARTSQAEGDDACRTQMSFVEDTGSPKSKLHGPVMAMCENQRHQPTQTQPSNFEKVSIHNRYSPQKSRIGLTSPEILLEDDIPDACNRSISLELGSENHSSKKLSRKPFFESLSQLPRKDLKTIWTQVEERPIDDGGSRTRSPRNLPWRENHSPPTPGMRPSRHRKDNSWLSTSGARNTKRPDPVAGGGSHDRTFLRSPESRIARSASTRMDRQVPDSAQQPRSDPFKNVLQGFPKSRGNSVAASSPSTQRKRKVSDSPGVSNRSFSNGVFEGSPASPILGTGEKSSGFLKPQRAPKSTKSGSRESDIFKISSLPLSKITPLQNVAVNKDERVKEWVDDQTMEQPSLKRKASSLSFTDRCKMLAAKRRRSSLLSNASTPNSTPQRRICTKPAGTSVEEPMTQKWEF
jgi:hypothetical protein